MKISQVVALAILPLASHAAKEPVGTFEQFHHKFLSSAPLKLDDVSYNALTTAPRDYGVAVLLTALEARFGCALCRDFQPEWDVLAKSWARGDKKGETRMLYGTLDFTDGKATFQKVRSNAFRRKLPTRNDTDFVTVDAADRPRIIPFSPHDGFKSQA